MKVPPESLAEARDRSNEARAEFRDALAAAREWASPSRLKAEAAIAATHQIDEVKAALRQSVRRKPVLSWSALAVGAAILTYILKKPVTALVRQGANTAKTVYNCLRKRT